MIVPCNVLRDCVVMDFFPFCLTFEYIWFDFVVRSLIFFGWMCCVMFCRNEWGCARIGSICRIRVSVSVSVSVSMSMSMSLFGCECLVNLHIW